MPLNVFEQSPSRVAARQTLDSQKNETHANQLMYIYSAIIITVIIFRQ